MTEDRDSKTAITRGLMNKCPSCGEGRLLRGYLGVPAECAVCHAPLGRYPAADGPAFFAMTVMLLLLIPLIGFTWVLFRPSPVMLLAITGTVSTVVTLILLRLIKGAFIGYFWAKNEQDRGS